MIKSGRGEHGCHGSHDGLKVQVADEVWLDDIAEYLHTTHVLMYASRAILSMHEFKLHR